jgi:hypothetical protein
VHGDAGAGDGPDRRPAGATAAAFTALLTDSILLLPSLLLMGVGPRPGAPVRPGERRGQRGQGELQPASSPRRRRAPRPAMAARAELRDRPAAGHGGARRAPPLPRRAALRTTESRAPSGVMAGSERKKKGRRKMTGGAHKG